MKVYVLDINGNPLMPTNPVKARKLLKNKKATAKCLKPFTIQLSYETTSYTQTTTLGIDSGYLNVGFSVITEKEELISGELTLLNQMSKRLQDRAMYRTQRRSRKRYRAPRFDNRKRKEGWLAPSIQHKLDSHLRLIEKLKGFLPISKIVLEVANFDIQKIKNPKISSNEYQEGEKLGFWNTREYILHRDNHKCQNPDCKNKSKEPILEVHHIVYESNGGTDKPSNLITLCNKCHTSPNHKKGKFLYNWQQNKPKLRSFKDATFMSSIRWKMLNILKEKYSNLEVKHTYGHITKNNRINNKIEKSHRNDAYVISGGTKQKRIVSILFEQIRRNNRSLEKFYDSKVIDTRTGKEVSGSELNSGRRTRNKNHNTENLRKYRGKKIKKGQRRIRKTRYFYQPGDLVLYENIVYTVRGTQNSGKYIALKEIKKVPKVEKLKPYLFRNGIA